MALKNDFYSFGWIHGENIDGSFSGFSVKVLVRLITYSSAMVYFRCLGCAHTFLLERVIFLMIFTSSGGRLSRVTKVDKRRLA